MATTNAPRITVLVREGEKGCGYGYPVWKQFLMVEDERVTILDMTAALYGWNFRNATVQSGDAWLGMDREAILAYKACHTLDGLTRAPSPPEEEWALAKLAEIRANESEAS